MGMLGQTYQHLRQAMNTNTAAGDANAPIPGTWNGRPIPQNPTSTSVMIPGYGNAPVTYGPGMGDPAFYGTPPPTGSGWRPNFDRTNSLMSGVMSQYMNDSLSPEQWRGLLPGRGASVPALPTQGAIPMSNYGAQASQMAGLLGAAPQPQQQMGGGLLGGGKGFRIPGGK